MTATTSDLPVLEPDSPAPKVGTRFLFKPTHRDGANVKHMELIAMPEGKGGSNCHDCVASNMKEKRDDPVDHIDCFSMPMCEGIGAFALATPQNVVKAVAFILNPPDENP